MECIRGKLAIPARHVHRVSSWSRHRPAASGEVRPAAPLLLVPCPLSPAPHVLASFSLLPVTLTNRPANRPSADRTPSDNAHPQPSTFGPLPAPYSTLSPEFNTLWPLTAFLATSSYVNWSPVANSAPTCSIPHTHSVRLHTFCRHRVRRKRNCRLPA